jgi:putative phage-type endonuclease
MGVSEFKTRLELYHQKRLPNPPPEETNFVAERGNRMEPKILALFNLMTGKNFKPRLLELEDTPLKVSLDGAPADGTLNDVLEIKTVGKDKHQEAKEGKVPAAYWPQVQHELAVSGADRCWYASYWDEEWNEDNIRAENLAIVCVTPDLEYQRKMLQAQVEFWKCVQDGTPPPPCEDDYKRLTGFAKQANRYIAITQKMHELSLERSQLYKEITDEAERLNEQYLKAGPIRLAKRPDGSYDFGIHS